MKRIILVLILIVGDNAGFAGHENGNSGGTLVRLMTHAERLIKTTLPRLTPDIVHIPEPAIGIKYKEKFSSIIKELPNMKVSMTSESIFDTAHGYESWIRLNSGEGFHIEYSYDPQKYKNFVGWKIPRYYSGSREIEKEAALPDVTEYLLHEIGHRMGLKEREAWILAESLIGHFKFNVRIVPMMCWLKMPISAYEVVSGRFSLEPEKTLRYQKRVGSLNYNISFDPHANMLNVDVLKERDRKYTLRMPAVDTIWLELAHPDGDGQIDLLCK